MNLIQKRNHFHYHRIGDVLLARSPPVWLFVGSSHDRVKPKTMKMVFIDSPVGTQHYGCGTKMVGLKSE